MRGAKVVQGRLIALGFIVVTALTIVAAMRANEENPRLRVARTFGEAIFNGHGLETLRVRDATGRELPTHTVRAIWEQLVEPSYRGCTVQKVSTQHETADRSEAWLTYRCGTRTGKLHAVSQDSPKGPLVSLDTMLIEAWLAKAHLSITDDLSKVGVAVVKGVSQDRATLERHGITELALPVGGKGSIDEFIRYWRDIASNN